MRIILNGFFWDQPYTGSGQYLHRLWRCLPALPAAQGHEFVLLRPAGPAVAAPPPLHPRARVRTLARGPLARQASLGQLWWEQIAVPLAVRRLRGDLLHNPYLSAPLFAPCPVVVTAHDLIPWVLPAYRRSRALRLYLRLAAAGCRRARLVLADSEASRRDVLRHFGLPPTRVRTVLLGIEPEFAARASPAALAEVLARHNLPPDFAFYIGGFDRRKNLPLLLRAWAAAMPCLRAGGPPPVLALAGRVPEPGPLFPDLPAFAAQLGLLDGDPVPLRFLGRVSEGDKRILLGGARLFAFPSVYEGFGYDPLEAMAAGAPVLAARSSSVPEVVGEAGLLLPPGDMEAWTAALVRVWQEAALRSDLQSRGRAQAARFRPEHTATATFQSYLTAAEGARE